MVSATPPASAAYRTIVVFGDTQDAVKGGGPLTQFQAMVDWITANKEAENIDAVLHVGDAIDGGTFAPLPARCSGEVATSTNLGLCLAHVDQTSCEAEPSPNVCFWGTGSCAPCGIMEPSVLDVPGQWVSLLAVIDDLQPGMDTVGGIPLALVAGNHDNVGPLGVGGYPDLDGQNPNTDASYLDAIEALFVGQDRVFEHIKTVDHGAQGLSHVYRINIGTQPVVVVAPAYPGGAAYTQTVIDWVVAEIGQYGEPVWLLAHDISENGGTLNAATWNQATIPPALFAVAGGHSPSARAINLSTVGDHDILRSVTDYSIGNVGDNWPWFTVYRFWMDTNEVEVFSYNPVLDSTVAGMARQSFTIPTTGLPSGLYDLSAYESDLVTVFDDNSVARPEWPVAPSVGAPTTAANCAQLNTALETPGTHVQVLTGTNLVCTTAELNIDVADIWLEMQGTASVEAPGDVFFGPNHIRLKITGGIFRVTGRESDISGSTGFRDVLFDNVVVEAGNNLAPNSTASDASRFALINSRVVTGDYGIFMGGDSANLLVNDSIIVANTDFDTGTGASTFQASVRLMGTTRLVFVDNRVANDDDGGTNHNFRMHSDTSHALIAGNQFENHLSQEMIQLISTSTGQQGDMTNIHLLRNGFYSDGGAGTNPIEIQAGYSTTVSPSSFNDLYVNGNWACSNGSGTPSMDIIAYASGVGPDPVFDTTGNSAGDFAGGSPCNNGTFPVYSGGADH